MICCRCHADKADTEFCADKTRPSGRRSICNPCNKEVAAIWHKENREWVKQRREARALGIKLEKPRAPQPVRCDIAASWIPRAA